MNKEKMNKLILQQWTKERLAEEWIREHIERKQLLEENEKLKELCNKYEEEHNTVFQEWTQDLLIRKKAIEYINHAQNYGTMAQVMPHLKLYVNGDDLLNILQGSEDDDLQ